MQDYREIKEIQSYAETPEDDENKLEFSEGEEEESQEEKKYSAIPMMQVICCALILFVLIYLKMFKAEKYTEVTDWYQQQIGAEIELPKLIGGPVGEEEHSQPDLIQERDLAEGFNVSI